MGIPRPLDHRDLGRRHPCLLAVGSRPDGRGVAALRRRPEERRQAAPSLKYRRRGDRGCRPRAARAGHDQLEIRPAAAGAAAADLQQRRTARLRRHLRPLLSAGIRQVTAKPTSWPTWARCRRPSRTCRRPASWVQGVEDYPPLPLAPIMAGCALAARGARDRRQGRSTSRSGT